MGALSAVGHNEGGSLGRLKKRCILNSQTLKPQTSNSGPLITHPEDNGHPPPNSSIYHLQVPLTTPGLH